MIHLGLSWVEAVALHHPFEVLLGQLTLFVGVHTSKGVVNVEARLSSQSFLEDLNMLVNLEVTDEDIKESFSSGFSEELGPWDTFEVNVFVLSLLQSMSVVAVLWREGLAEVRVQEARIMVTVPTTAEVVHVVFVSERLVFVQEGQNLGCTHISKILGVNHLEAIHQVKVCKFNQGLLLFFQSNFLLDDIIEQLNHFSFVIQ